MKILQKTLFGLVAISLFSASAQASVEGVPYIGFKVGQIASDDYNGLEFNTALAYGLYAGYTLSPAWAIEAQYVTSEEADILVNDVVSGTYDSKLYGAYAAYRYDFPNLNFYAKGKLGFSNLETNAVLEATNETVKNTVKGLAGGVGLGYSFTSNASIEAEYEINQGGTAGNLLTIGANYRF